MPRGTIFKQKTVFLCEKGGGGSNIVTLTFNEYTPDCIFFSKAHCNGLLRHTVHLIFILGRV